MEVKVKQRIALSIYFFLTGFCFSTWASRIPTIKTAFNFNEAQLGNLLLAMPISSLIGLPISGWLVSKFHSRSPLLVSFIFFTIALMLIGQTTNIYALIIAVSIFSFCMRILNISMNTQAIALQKNYGKKINGSFHGLWSIGGIAGVGFSTLMVKFQIPMTKHLLYVAIFSFLLAILAYRFLLSNDRSPHGNKLQIGKPDKFILYLGLLVFFAAICEGGMFDWSGVYFREVVHEEIFTLGYLIFMIFMAFSRFFSDKIIDNIGIEKMYILSAITVAFGISIVIIFPYFWTSIIGFSFVGLGVAAIFPMTFSLAGTSKKYSAGMAISIISTYSTIGMLLGPPIVGYIAHLFNLRVSFILFMVAGLMLIPVSQLFFKHQKKEN
ncbi:MFS transporter [Lutibacter sp. B1]|uniref:MFS transporter n=1 Tax=Lutibacter sp. B1 TaxID=2725996 RepID=UPI0014577D74|nr:MFS transporter [Lutibacter sp. B1]NLP58320.1 MFS transporter [Lutibacter sp. B1]